MSCTACQSGPGNCGPTSCLDGKGLAIWALRTMSGTRWALSPKMTPLCGATDSPSKMRALQPCRS
eukprot:9090438-Pyramimonas_sp.AAC.1